MNDSIIIEPQTFGSENNYIQEICFSSKSFQAQCSVQDSEKADRLKQRIYALREIYDTDVTIAESRQNFEVELDGKTVVLKGNLLKAFQLMQEKKLITSALFKSMKGHPGIFAILEKSKSYISPDESVKNVVPQKNNISPHLRPKCNVL